MIGVFDKEKAKQFDDTTKKLKGRYEELRKTNSELQTQGGLFSRLSILAGRYINIFSIFNIGRRIAETTGFFEQQQVALEGILGSALDAQVAINEIKKMALKSPFETKDIVAYTKQLAAYGITGNDLLPTVKELGDLSAGLGVDMGRLILAYGQVKSASVLRGQELRQFTEAGVPMVQKLADKFTELNGKLVTTGDVFELISKRQVSFEMVASVLKDMTSEGGQFYNMQENITETLYGQIQKLKDVWTIGLNDVGKRMSGFIKWIVSISSTIVKNFSGIFAAFTTFTGVSVVKRFFNSILESSESVRATWEKTQRLVHSTDNAMRKLRITMMGVRSIARSIYAMISSMVTLLVVSAVIGAIRQVITNLNELDNKLKDVNEESERQRLNRERGFDSILNRLSDLKKGTKEYDDTVKTLLTNYGKFVNSGMVDALVEERKNVERNAESWGVLRDAVISAMKAESDYELKKARKATAAESAQEAFEKPGIMRNLFTDAGFSKYMLFLRGTKMQNGRYINSEEQASAKDIVSMAVGNFFANGNTTKEELYKLIQAEAKRNGDIKLGEFILMYIDRLWTALDTKDFRTYLDENKSLRNDKIDRENRIWDLYKNRLSDYRSENDPFGYSKYEDQQFILGVRHQITNWNKDLKKRISESSVGDYIGDVDKFNKARRSLNSALSSEFDEGKTYRIASAMKDLANTINDPTVLSDLERIREEFEKLAGTKSDIAAKVSENVRNLAEKYENDSFALNILRQYDPTDQTLDSLRERVSSRLSELEGEINNFKSINIGGIWDSRISDLQRELKLMQELSGELYYNVNPKKKTTGSNHTEKMNGALGLFTKMYDRIKAAKDAQKQLVEGSAGFTNELKNQISTLETSPLRYFYGETQGNPFADIVSDLQKLGLNIKGLDLSKLNAVATDVTTAGFANFEGTWAALTEALKTIADGIKDPELKNRLISYIEGKDLDGEKLFGIDEVKGKIDEAIRSLTKIEKETKRISEKNDLVESLGEKVGYEAASQAILGQSYGFHDRAGAAKKAIEDMLAAPGGAGVNAQFGNRIRALFAKGTLGLNSIPTILELIDDMNKFAEEIKVGDDGKTLGTFEMMKEAIAVAVGELENLNEGIKDVALTMAAYESIEDQAVTELKNAVAIYEKANAVIDSEYFDKDKKLARTTAANNMYDAILNVFGATASPDWVKNMYGTNRDGVMSGLVGMSFKDQSIYAKVEEYLNKVANGETVDTDKFSKEVRDLADGIDKAAAIVKKIGSTLQNVSEVLNGLYDLIDATDGVYNKGGVYYNGNTASARQITSTFTDLGSGIVGMAESFLNGDLGSVATKAITTLFTLLKNIAGVQDSIKQDKIDELALDNAILEKKRSELEWLDTFNAGYDKIVNSMERANTLEAESLKYKQMEMLEASKKNADADKANEFANKSLETHREAVRMLQEVQNAILSTADSVANTLSNALVNAFRNGTNAARAWRDAVKTYIGDALANMLITQMLAPQLQDLMNEYMYGRDHHGKILNSETAAEYYGDEAAAQKKAWERMSDPAHVEKFGKDLNQLGTNWIDQFEGFSQIIKDYIGFNPSSSSLSGGIQSITEDTARRMEALSNSQLGELYHIRQAVDSIMRNGAGQTQMATLQSNIASINSNVALMYALMQNVTRGINKFHVTMS